MTMYDPNPEANDPRLTCMNTGIVIDRDDPEGLGRVRIQIPGFIDEGTAWAWPLGLGGGTTKRGSIFVPPLNAEVAVFFRCGDVDQPYYIGGNLGRTEQLTGTDGDPDVRAIETDTYVLNIDERAESRSLTLLDKSSGCVIQMNGRDRAIAIQAVASVQIEAKGFVYINGLEVFVNGVQCGLGKI